MINRYVSIILLSLLVPLPRYALAQDACDDLRGNVLEAQDDIARILGLGRLAVAGCLGGQGDDWALAKALDERLQPLSFESTTRLDRAAAAVTTEIARRAREIEGNADSPSIADAFQATAQRLDELAAQLQRARWERTDIADAGRWELQRDLSVPALPDVDMRSTFISGPCGRTADSCRAALTDAMELLRLTHVAQRALVNVYSRAGEFELDDRLRRYDRQWTAYFTEARSQFPWELWANGKRYALHKDERYCDQQGGFCSPPEYQWILLHPGVALEYVEGSPSGNRVEPALVLELIGYNQWTWNGASMGTAFGGSVIGVVSDRADTEDVGYGIMLHYNHRWSIGITRHGGATGMFLSYELWETAETRVDSLRNRILGSE
ncbi:MAG: hypothetical protein WED00_07805 [Aquisalimonadaceae bacterium]